MAEQKAEDEKRKIQELTKQIVEERQIQELRQLQVASGHVVKTIDTTLDWMYEGPLAQQEQQQQSSEEYLLGKVYQPKDNEVTDIHKISKGNGYNCNTWHDRCFNLTLLLFQPNATVIVSK